MKTALRVKRLVAHSENCVMGKYGNDRSWCANGTTSDFDSVGRQVGPRRHGSYWLKFKCNDPGCPAEVAVLADSLDLLIEAALERLP